MKTQQAYGRWASSYDSMENKTRDLEKRAAKAMLDRYSYEEVLELGCGTGKNTAWLSGQANVTALDFSEQMLAEARRKLKGEAVQFIEADLTQEWPVARNNYDLISCSLTLEHIQDLEHIFEQAWDKLKEGGVFYLCELHPYKQYQGSKARFDTDNGTVELEAFVHHISDYIHAAYLSDFKLLELMEWSDEGRHEAPPRLAAFIFQK